MTSEAKQDNLNQPDVKMTTSPNQTGTIPLSLGDRLRGELPHLNFRRIRLPGRWFLKVAFASACAFYFFVVFLEVLAPFRRSLQFQAPNISCVEKVTEKTPPTPPPTIHPLLRLAIMARESIPFPTRRKISRRPSRRRHILVLSSVGRSGSSFLAELIASLDYNIYFFEAVKMEHLDASRKTSQSILRNVFHCNISDSLATFGRRFHVFHHPELDPCFKHKCLTAKSIKQTCKSEPVRLAKVIRVRLHHVKDLLDDPKLDLKIVHVLRDPRGSFTSMKRLGWTFTYRSYCTDIYQDLVYGSYLLEEYPNRYMQIKYEDFFRDVPGNTKKLLRFLQPSDAFLPPKTMDTSLPCDNPLICRMGTRKWDLPPKVVSFLESATSISDYRPFGINRRWSQNLYQSWRHKILEKDLVNIEASCKDVLDLMGHNTFGSLSAVRDIRRPLAKQSRVHG